jgi:riboflavin synthase
VERTTIAHWPTGQILNLERALSLQSRLGGHLVQGHIDGIGTIKTISRRTSETVFEIASDKYLARYIIFKGSITVDGISLTVASTKGELFKIAVIPHTWENTNLQFRKIGDKVNIETDVIARYVEKMMVGEGNTNNLSEENLRRAGF